MTKVSVICVAYNHEGVIGEALDSFLDQKRDFDLEVIVHDDVSTDGTQEILLEYQRKYPNIIKLIFEKTNQVSKGDTTFLDRMFKMSTGDYIAMCDGDDYWTDKTKLKKQVKFLEKNKDYALCFHPAELVKDGKKIGIFPDTEDKEFTLGRLLGVNYIHTNTVVYRRQDYSDLSCIAIPNDWYIHLFHARFGKIGFIDELMAVYRLHTGGIWQRDDKSEHDFWIKHGPGHIRMHQRVEDLFKNTPEYPLAVESTTRTARIIYRAFGKQNDTRTTKGFMRDFPDETARLILADQVELEENKQTIDTLNVAAYKRGWKLEVMQQTIDDLRTENKRIHTNLERTAEYKIKRVLDRAKKVLKKSNS